MANIVDGQIEWLKDESTGVPVGFKKKNGTEGGLVTAETNPLTGGIELSVGGEIISTPVFVTMAQAQSQLAAASVGACWNVSDVGGGSVWTKTAGGVLKPVNNVLAVADIASPVTFSAGITQRIYAEYLLPAKTLANGFHFQVDPVFSKSGAVDAMTMNIAMSATPGTVGTTISQTASVSILLAANRRAQGSMRFQRLTETTIGNTVTNTTGGSGINLASGGAYAALTVPSMNSAVYLQVCGTASGSTDTMQLESCLLTLFANPNA